MIKLDEKIISICITIFILITVVSPIFTITAEAADTNYYISNSGNDANSGTSPDQAWKTKTKLNTELNPSDGCINDGDDIYFNRGDNFSEDVYIALKTTDGTASDPMVFGAYGTGADPIIYGSTVASSPQFYFTSGGIGYLTFENLYFKAYPGCPSNYNFIAGNSGDKNNITIRNCTFDGNNYGANANKGRVPMRNVHNYTIEYCTFIDASHYLYGAGAGGEPCSNTKMMHCTIDAKGGSQDNMQIHCDYDDPTGVSSNHYIYNVTSTNCTSNAFDIVGGWEGRYKCNHVYLKNCTGSVTGSNSPLVIGHGVSNVTVDNCYFEGALYLTRSNDTIVRNSVFKKASDSGGYIISLDDPQWAFGWGTQNATIYNCNFIIGSATRFLHANVGQTHPKNLSGFTVKNNIFYSTEYSSPDLYFLYDPAGGGTWNLSNTDSNYSYNMWWRGDGDMVTDRWQDEDGTYNLTEWNANEEVYGELGDNASMSDSTGTDFDNDFNLTSDSPCINAGDWLTTTNGGSTGTTITVHEANYFFQGISTLDISGDNIFVGDDTNLEVTSVDYIAETITVNRSITWSDGDNVSLSSYSGSKPDIGAKEFDSN